MISNKKNIYIILLNLFYWGRFMSRVEQLFTEYVPVKFMWLNNISLSVIFCLLNDDDKEDENVVHLSDDDISYDISSDTYLDSLNLFITNHSTFCLCMGIFVVGLGILGVGYWQGYIFNNPYVFTEAHSNWDFSNYNFDLLLILKKPVTKWTYSDMLLIEFYKPDIFNHLDFSKLDPQLLCKFFSFFKSTNLSDIRFTIPDKYLGYVLDPTNTIIPQEFEPFYKDCLNNIIIDWTLVDPNILKEVKETLPLVLSNSNADPNLVAKLLHPDFIDVTRKVLLEIHGIHPSLIEIYISNEIMEAAREILTSGVF